MRLVILSRASRSLICGHRHKPARSESCHTAILFGDPRPRVYSVPLFLPLNRPSFSTRENWPRSQRIFIQLGYRSGPFTYFCRYLFRSIVEQISLLTADENGLLICFSNITRVAHFWRKERYTRNVCLFRHCFAEDNSAKLDLRIYLKVKKTRTADCLFYFQ